MFNRKKFSSAVGLLRKSLQYQQDAKLAQQGNYWIAESYAYKKKYNEAAPYYRKAIDLGSDLAKYGLAYVYYNTKDYTAAGDYFGSFISAYQPDIDRRYFADALKRSGDCYFVAKDYDRSIGLYKKALNEKGKDQSYLYYQLGIVYRYKSDNNNAIDSFEQLIENNPKSDRVDDALFQIAQITYEGGDYNAAVKKYQSYLRKYPESNYVPFALLNQAVSYHNLKKYNKASENYELILDRFSRHETANSALLGLQELAGMGEFDDFSKYLDKYKAANPDSDALENIEFETAKTMYYNQQYDQSIASFNKFIGSYPQSTLVLESKYFIADAYYRKSNIDKALEAFYEIANNHDYSKYNKIIYRIAVLESKKGNYEKSRTYFSQLKQSANSRKETVNALNGLMEAHYQLRTYDSAAFYARDLIENRRISNEIESSATLHIGRSEYELGNKDEAFDWLLLLVSNVQDERGAEAKYYISKILYDKKDYKQSLKSLFELTDKYAAFDNWVGKAFLLMSDNYLATDELFQAEATLNSLIENSSSEEIKQQAREKLKVIKEAEKEELIIEKDTLEVEPKPEENNGQQ